MKTINFIKMQDLADYINAADEWPADVEDIIEANGWVSDTGEIYGVCHNDKEKVIMDGDGKAIVTSCEPEPEEPTYDVFFNDNEKSNNLGLDLTYDEALDIIKDRRNPYFDDYKGGSVSIVNTETEEAVYTEEIEGDPKWEDMSYEEKEEQVRTLDESYDFGQYDSVEEAADNVVTGYKEDPDWFDFRVLDVDGFREDLEYFIKRR